MLAAEPEIALDFYASSKAPVAAYLPDLSSVNTIDQFAALAIGRADLSRAASRVAVEEASRADVKKFAERELVEAETLVTVLEDLGTPLPQMGGERWAATRTDHQRPGRPHLRYGLHSHGARGPRIPKGSGGRLPQELQTERVRPPRTLWTPIRGSSPLRFHRACQRLTPNSPGARNMTERSPATKTAGASRRDVLVGGAAIAATGLSWSALAHAATPNIDTPSEEKPSMSTITTKDGTEIFYKDWGPKDAQPIVFHHGWPLSADDWDTQMLFFLQKGYRVIAHDRRGHGRSAQVIATVTTWTTTPPTSRRWSSISTSGTPSISVTPPAAAKRRTMSPGTAAGPRRQAHHHRRRAADHGEDAGQSRRHADRGVRRLAQGTRRQPCAVLSRSPSGPFYGFNRPGAKPIPGVIQNWWRQGMMGSAKAHYEGIKAFSETDFTEDLKIIDVPTLVMHGDDDQIVPIADSAPLSAKLLKNGTLKVYEKFPHGMCTTHADVVNPDLLAFIVG